MAKGQKKDLQSQNQILKEIDLNEEIELQKRGLEKIRIAVKKLRTYIWAWSLFYLLDSII